MRTAYLPNGSSSSVSGVRPRHRPFTETPARLGFDSTTSRPLAATGRLVELAGVEDGASVPTGGGAADVRSAVAEAGGVLTACSLQAFPAGPVVGAVCGWEPAGCDPPVAIGGPSAPGPRDPTPYPTANPTRRPSESIAANGNILELCAGTTAAAVRYSD